MKTNHVPSQDPRRLRESPSLVTGDLGLEMHGQSQGNENAQGLMRESQDHERGSPDLVKEGRSHKKGDRGQGKTGRNQKKKSRRKEMERMVRMRL